MHTIGIRAVRTILTTAAAFGAAVSLQAQPTAHYPPGVEGIKGASLPPPGFYFRDYNLFYSSSTFHNESGHSVGNDPGLFVYAQIPRFIWITDLEVLGGNIGVDALLPLEYLEVKHVDHTFGIGDLFGEVTWSRHLQQFDLSAGYGIFAPTGDFDIGKVTAGQGYWGHMLTAGATWYVDAEKKWAVSALNRYEFNMEQDKAEITPGQAYTLEWGVSRTLCTNYEVGVVGYYQQQVTSDTHQPARERDRVAAVGPEVSTFCSHLGLNASLRYLYEFMSENRFQGHTVCLTLTKRF